MGVLELQISKKLKYTINCPLCSKEITFEIDDKELFSNLQGNLATFTLESHGDPPHIVTAYIDKNREIIGSYPSIVKSAEKSDTTNLQYNHIVDATADITFEEAINYGLEIIPYELIINGKVKRKYLSDVSPAEVLKLLMNNMKIESRAIEVEDFLKTFRFYDNKKPIIVNTCCSKVSKNYINALKAKKKIAKENEKLAERINIFDTNTVGTMLKIIATNAIEMDKKGREINEIMRYIDWMRSFHRTYFMVDNIENLKRSNILGTFTGVFSGVRGTKPLIACNVGGEGIIEPCKNIKSYKEGMGEIARLIKNDFRGREIKGKIFHCMAEENAQRLSEYLEIILKVNKEDFPVEPVGSSVCIHGGVGMLGLSVFPKI